MRPRLAIATPQDITVSNIYSMSCTSEEHLLDGIEEENDLGVLFNSSLKFGNHISKIVHKANRLLGLIKRTFSYLEPQMLRLLYTTYIN